MSRSIWIDKAESLYATYLNVVNLLQAPVMLAIRGYWGWQFFHTGWGKLTGLDQVTEFFTQLGIPAPHLNALIAGSTECFGGLLLLLGLGSRLVSVPLAFTMLVAYATASRDALLGVFHDPDTFIQADPFLFLLTAVLVLSFGPGYFSLDTVVKKVLERRRAA